MTPDEAAAAQVGNVRRYYDRNTALFQRLGQGGSAIHRAVWAPGVSTAEQAFTVVEDGVLALLADVAAPRVVDLGCGVGASLIHLARAREDLRGEGITISPVQAERAAELVAAAGLQERVRCRVGDFLDPPADLVGAEELADLAYSIEAFIHGPDPAAYFRCAATLLRPGGLLVVCDDFLTERALRPSAREARRLDEIRTGWRAGSLVTAAQALGLAADAGLEPVKDDDLTGFLQLRRPRDRAISALVTLARPLRPRGERWNSLVGGDALQAGLTGGLLEYRLLVVRRP